MFTLSLLHRVYNVSDLQKHSAAVFFLIGIMLGYDHPHPITRKTYPLNSLHTGSGKYLHVHYVANICP